MSTGLHSAREELGLPSVLGGAGATFMGLSAQPPAPHQHPSQSQQQAPHDAHSHSHALHKPLELSPRTFGMDDLRDFCGPLGTFKTGLTPRFSTGLTPRSGFTPRFSTGFTPRINITGLSQQPPPQQQQAQSDTNAFFSRNTGFSPRASDAPQSQKISPTGFTPKDVTGMKMRYPGSFNGGSPQKLALGQPQLHHPQPIHYSHHHHPGHHEPMGQNELAMNMSMYEYMSRPTLHQPPPALQQQQQQQAPLQAHLHLQDMRGSSSKTSPVSDKGSDQEDLDERRRMKNRERVRKCRKRKQDRLNFLEDRTAELEKENHQLKSKMARQMANSGGAAAAEPPSEAQLKEQRARQSATIGVYIRAYNEAESGAFDATAHNVWTESAEVAYGNSGSALCGLEAIVGNKRASSAVFSLYKIKQYTVQWKPSDKCAVHWEVDVAIHPDAPRDVPLTAPFADLGGFFGPSEVLSFRMTSHLTFEGDRIVEEIRQPNLMPISEAALAKFAQDPKQAADVLRCLLVAA